LPAKGCIGLQDRGLPLEIRNVGIKELSAE
jgi:hypothetical protein